MANVGIMMYNFENREDRMNLPGKYFSACINIYLNTLNN